LTPRAYLECVEGGSSKFYELSVRGTVVVSRYGRIGAAGQTSEKAFDSEEKARLFYQRTLSEKLLKGYQQA
jgi:predicted DNA-binding WGR domain protein